MSGDLVPVEAEIVARIEPERQLRMALLEPARKALEKPGAVIKIQGGSHVTITALTEIAGLIGIGVTVTSAEYVVDPITGADCAHVVATATRPDGVECSEIGYASTAEKTRQGNAKWPDWHALASMAATRAKVRVLTTMLMPVLRTAGDYEVAPTPAETMPEYTPETEPFDVD